jgi:hypothetical protein
MTRLGRPHTLAIPPERLLILDRQSEQRDPQMADLVVIRSPDETTAPRAYDTTGGL